MFLVESNRYFHGNEIPKRKWKLVKQPDLLQKSWCQILKLRCMAREICKNEEILNVWFRINRENISNHSFCLMKLNGLKEEYYFNKIAPKTPKCALIKVMSWGHKSFVGLCFHYLANETITNWEQFFDSESFIKNLKSGSIDFY